MNIKDFECCGSNEWLISRSEARATVRGFRQDLKEGRFTWDDVFGFCINCGSEFTYFCAIDQKGWEVANEFHKQQFKRSSGQSFSHKVKKAGGFSKRQMKYLEKYSEPGQMAHFWDRQIEALDKINPTKEDLQEKLNVISEVLKDG